VVDIVVDAARMNSEAKAVDLHQHAPRHTLIRKIRFTPIEWSTVVERARACGTPPARFVREAAIGAVPRVRRSQANADLIRALGRVGNNLNQLAAAANRTGRGADAAAYQSVLDALLDVLRRVE
jgi:hypothetical protein